MCQAPGEGGATVDVEPANSGEAFRLRGAPPRVTRLSRKTLAVLGVAAGVGIGGSLIYALQPHAPAQPPPDLYGTDRAAKANAVTAAPADYSKVPKLGPPLPGDLGRPILNAQANGQTVPVPPMGGTEPPPDPRLAREEQARQRVAQERDTARTSSLFLASANAGASGGTAPTAQSPARSQPPIPSPGSCRPGGTLGSPLAPQH